MFGYYTVICFITIFLLIIMEIIIVNNTYFSKEMKRGFVIMYFCIMLAAIAEYLGVCLDGAPKDFIVLHKLVKFVEFIVAPMIPLTCATEIFKIRHNDKKIFYMILVVHALLEFVSLFLGFIFYVDEQNVYHHGKLYAIYTFTYIVSFIFFFATVKNFSKRYQNKNVYVIIAVIIFMICGISIQTFYTDIKIDWLTVTTAGILIYVYYNELISYIDGLTQLFNQRSYLNYTSSLDCTAIIILFDIDGFKQINDKFGHQYGDKCLIEVAKIIKEVYSKYGFCYRIGGDEFCVVIRDESQEYVNTLNQQFDLLIKRTKMKDSKIPTVSYGYACFNPEYDIMTDIIEEADKNMYKCKREKN